VGLVETPNDFGFNGSRPSHPELLDWLASEFVRGGYSWKHLHRLILNSATWQQASLLRPEPAGGDAANRLLWRKAPQRLAAEELRDAVLCVAGVQNPEMGGPGYRDFRTFTFNSQFYERLDPVGYAFQRRSIYRTWVRSGTSALLDVLDCPDPSTTAPRRAVTTTPLQALALLNNSFMLRMSAAFADRLREEAPNSAEDQVRRGFEIALVRAPAELELAAAVQLVHDHGLPAFCRALFNCNEFLYVD